MRTIIRQAIIDDATLAGLGVVDAAVLAGDVDTPQQRPFINLRWATTTPGLSTVDKRVLVIWVHDEPGDYSRIDGIIIRLRALITSMEAQQHDDGWLVKTEWNGDSDDLTDDGHGTITRNMTFTLVGSGQ